MSFLRIHLHTLLCTMLLKKPSPFLSEMMPLTNSSDSNWLRAGGHSVDAPARQSHLSDRIVICLLRIIKFGIRLLQISVSRLIRPDVPDDIRAWLDSMDEKTLRESLKAIGDACRAAGFDPAMQACGEILRSNRDMGLHADSLTPIALRMRDGEWEYPGGIEEPDLSGYDRFITGTDDGGEER